jgi:glycosyltransferase involved in cell wall biosynthesis
LLDYVRVLAQRAEVHVFALRYPHRLDCYDVYGATVHSLNGADAAGPSSPALWARAVREISREHRRTPFDVLHAFWAYEPGPVAVWAGRRLAERSGREVPVVVSLAGGELADIPAIRYGLQRQTHRRALIGWALSRARAVTGGSRYLLDQLDARPDRSSGPARSHYAPPGVDAEMFTPAVQANDGCILNVASFMPVKGHTILLRAFALASREVPTARLIMVGQDAAGRRPRVAQLAAELGVAERVEFRGEVPHEALPEVYRSAALCAQASDHEAQGLAVLEAAACGVPTVGTIVGILPELAPAEWLCPPGDAEALARVLAEGLKRPQAMRQLGRGLRAKVEREFSLEAGLERFWRVYLDVTGRM